MTDLVPGTWLGDWILEERIGAGGFARVFRARHGSSGDVAAVKVPTDPRFIAHLRREGRGAALHHPRIVAILEEHLDHDPPFVVLDLIEGGSLREGVDGGIPPERALRLVGDVAAALDHAHEHGTLHLDVKPENVLLRADGGAALLTDFGAEADRDGQALAQSLELSGELGRTGTRDYAAPELRRGDGVLDRRADVYSLGVLTYELLTGTLPLGLDRPSQLVASIPPAVDDLLTRALALDPRRRPLSAGAFASALREAFSDRAGAPAPEEAAPAAAGRAAAGAAWRWWWLVPVVALGLSLLAVRSDPAAPAARSSEDGRIGALLEEVPRGGALGLLPVEDLGRVEPGPRARALRAALDRAFARRRLRVHDLPAPAGDPPLHDEGVRRALAARTGCETALRAVVPADARVPARDGQLFLVDLVAWRIVAASPARLGAARRLAAELAAAVPSGRGAPLRVVVLPTVDAARGVSNETTAAFDGELTAALARAAGSFTVGARAGMVARLQAAAGPAEEHLDADLVVQSAIDARRSVVTARLTRPRADRVVAALEVPFVAPHGYEVSRGSERLTVDDGALRRLGTHLDREVARATERASAHLFRSEPGRAIAVLQDLRARERVYARRLHPLLLLARAHLDLERRERALQLYEEALALAPEDARVHEDYARACLAEARRLYEAGQGPWYGDDDEVRFREALAVLARVEGLPLEGGLARDVAALRGRLEDEM